MHENTDVVPQARLQDIPILLFVRGAGLLLAMVGVTLGLHYYLGVRLIDQAGIPGPWDALLWAALWTACACIVMASIGRRVLPRRPAKVFQWLGFSWMGAFGMTLTAVVVSDLVLAVASLWATPRPEWDVARALAVVAVVVPVLVVGRITARQPKVKRVTVPVAGLHPDLDGFRLVQLSDVHIGETLDRRFAEKVVGMVNGLDPDAVCITGDMVDGSVEQLVDEVAPLAALRSRHGTFFVTGNHEYYAGASAWMAEASRLGMTVLHNQHVVLSRGGGRLVIGGVPDVEGARFAQTHTPDAQLAFEGAPSDAPRVLLAHQPRFALRAGDARVALMLSGHTHGGQMMPFNAFVKLQQPVVGGLNVIGGVTTYTSLGTGYWGPPFRVGTRGEVTELTLKSVA